jgi:predicted transcriptional regulator
VRKPRVVGGYRLGTLEARVLEILWSAGRPLSVREVTSLLEGRRLAYTTVMTVLARLHQKGVVERVPSGRAYLYRPAARTPEELAAKRIRELVEAARDPRAVLAHLVTDLARDPELRQVLEELARERGP